MLESFWKVSKVENSDLFVVHTTSNMCRQYIDVHGNLTKDFFKARFFTSLKEADEYLYTDPRFSQIVEELGGFRQVSKVIPLIQKFNVYEVVV